MFRPGFAKAFAKPFSGVFKPPWASGLSLPREGLLAYFKASSGMTDSIGISFSGTFPDVTMTISTGCPLIGVGPFEDGGSYLLSALPHNIDNQFFWGEYGIAVYSSAQTDSVSRKALRYLRESWWPQGLVFANDVFTLANDRGPEMQLSYAGGVADGSGGLTTGAPVHAGKGLWNGPAYTQLLPNPLCSGAVVGTPGTLPTGMTGSTMPNNGIYREIVEVGYGYFTVRFYGTVVGATANFNISMNSSFISAAVSDIFSAAVNVEVVDSTGLPNVFDLRIASFQGGTWLINEATTPITASGNLELTGTEILSATADGVRFLLGMAAFVDTVVDFTIKVSKPNLFKSRYQLPYLDSATTSASAAATSAGNGPPVEMDEQMLRVLRGAPDGVELWDDDTASNNAGWVNNGDGTWTFTHGSGDASIYLPAGLAEGVRTIREYEIINNSFDGLLRCPDGVAVVDLGSSVGPHRVVITNGSSGLVTFRCVGGTGGSLTIRVNSVQKLNPAVGTVAVETYMGVGSDELDTGFIGNCVATSDSTFAGALYYDKAGGDDYVVKSSDKSSYPGLIDPWNRNEVHKRVVQTSADGAQFRVGYRRYNSDGTTPITDWVWSTYSAFDGSFNPLEFLRFGFNLTVPQWHRSCHFWNRSDVTEAEIEAPFALT